MSTVGKYDSTDTNQPPVVKDQASPPLSSSGVKDQSSPYSPSSEMHPLYSLKGPVYTTRGSWSTTGSDNKDEEVEDSDEALIGSPRSMPSSTSEPCTLSSSDLREESDEERRFYAEDEKRMQAHLDYLHARYYFSTYGRLDIEWGRFGDPPNQVQTRNKKRN